MTRSSRRVFFLAIPPVEGLDLVGPHDVLAAAGGYQLQVCSPNPARLLTGSGLQLAGAISCSAVRGPIDTFIVVGGEGAKREQDEKLLSWVRRTAQHSRRVASICTGAFVLAAAGLLEGKRAVTHWRFCELLRQRHPVVRVDSDALFLRQGKIYTSAGVTAGIDLTLALVEEDYGGNKARSVAQDLVLFLRRSGGQRQFSELLEMREPQRDNLQELRGWMIDHVAENLSLERLAAQASMSLRHFCRVFQTETGIPPGKYVERIRIEVARELLQQTKLGLKDVSHRCGFESADRLRRVFLRSVGISPSDFRRRFGGDQQHC